MIAHHVKCQRRPAVLALRLEAVVELGGGGARVRLAPGAGAQLDDRVRLLRAGREDAARPVVLERAADQRDAVGQQRRGERIAGMALVGAAVELEQQRLAAVDEAAGGDAVGLRHAHDCGLAADAATAGPGNLVRAHVARHHQPLVAAALVIPQLPMLPGGVVAQVDVVVPQIERGVVDRPLDRSDRTPDRRVAEVSEFLGVAQRRNGGR